MVSTVSTTTDQYGSFSGFQRKTFIAAGLYWVFYGNGSKLCYRTSSDGSTWSSENQIESALGYYVDVLFDGTYVHYVNCYGGVYYRRGTPNSNGTITWSASEQTITGYSGISPLNATLCVDANGYT